MIASIPAWRALAYLCAASILSACGGGDDTVPAAPAQLAQFNAGPVPPPVLSGDTARDGFNWINYRRAQVGLPLLTQHSALTFAAQSQSDYQQLNGAMTHNQRSGQPGFLGVDVAARMLAAGYVAPGVGYAYGEVIAAASTRSGFTLAESLLTAIYHRFVILTPSYQDGGAGAASNADGYTYLTADFGAKDSTAGGLARGSIVTLPFANQDQVPVNFFSDTERPDPVPDQNEVGYPISVHSNTTASLKVQTFTVQLRGGTPLPTRLLSSDTDPETPISAAAILPLAALQHMSIYDVSFDGSLNGTAISRHWSFLTQ